MYIRHLLIFGFVMVVSWSLITYFWPRMLLSVYKRALLSRGFGDRPFSLNTLYTQPQKLFEEPIAMQTGSSSSSVAAGMNHDTLMSIAWLDLRNGPLVFHVPDMHDRYYSVQFTDPSKNTVFNYVGKRTTGTQAGDYLITGPGWKGTVPQGVKQISSPNHAVLLIGRVLVENDNDVAAAYELSTQIQLTPLSQFQPVR